MASGQLRGGLRKGHTAVVSGMPLRRADLGQEALHLGFVSEQLAVEVTGVPVEQHAADVKDDGVRFLVLNGPDRASPVPRLWELRATGAVARSGSR